MSGGIKTPTPPPVRLRKTEVRRAGGCQGRKMVSGGLRMDECEGDRK